MNMFFSVDVETSNLTPWSPDGELLTVGAVAVRYDPRFGADSTVIEGEFYVRIDQEGTLDSWWYEDELFAEDAPSDTAKWWSEQNTAAQDEAWRDLGLVRHAPDLAARMLREFVVHHAYNVDATFVANPVSFDKMWVDALFAETGIASPFHYRSLCLRSMRFGLDPRSEYGSVRETHDPVIPHHALHDARAQALDLIEMLERRDAAKAV